MRIQATDITDAILWHKHVDTQRTHTLVNKTTLKAVLRRRYAIATMRIARTAQMTIMVTIMTIHVVGVLAIVQESEPLWVPPRVKVNNRNKIKAKINRIILIHLQWLPLSKCTKLTSSKTN